MLPSFHFSKFLSGYRLWNLDAAHYSQQQSPSDMSNCVVSLYIIVRILLIWGNLDSMYVLKWLPDWLCGCTDDTVIDSWWGWSSWVIISRQNLLLPHLPYYHKGFWKWVFNKTWVGIENIGLWMAMKQSDYFRALMYRLPLESLGPCESPPCLVVLQTVKHATPESYLLMAHLSKPRFSLHSYWKPSLLFLLKKGLMGRQWNPPCNWYSASCSDTCGGLPQSNGQKLPIAGRKED